MKKLNTLIIFGGVSNEYEVSLRSVCTIAKNLDTEKFTPFILGITKDGKWLLTDNNLDSIKDDTWQNNAIPAILSPDRSTKGILVFKENSVRKIAIDVVFIASHGQNCEDGTLQGLIKLSGIPFTGAGVCSSAACFDKEITHIVAERNSIPMAKWVAVKKSESFESILEKVKSTTGFPAFIKPANSGSSVGTCPIADEKDLKKALETAFAHDNKAIIEELIKGHEVECAVMGNSVLEAPQTGEIVAPSGFYDYDSKYKNDSAKLLIPANINFDSGEEVKKLAKKAFISLGCRGYARVDFFVTQEGKVIFNEINTLPGFTSISMFPQMMCVSDYSLKELISRLLSLALEA